MTYHYRFWKSEGEYLYFAIGSRVMSLFYEPHGQEGELQKYISTTKEFAEIAYESWDNPHKICAGDMIIVNGDKATVLRTYVSADGAIEVITNLRTSVVDSAATWDSKLTAWKEVECRKHEKFAAGRIVPIEAPKKKRWWEARL
ncbi:MAG: hypothetical protein J7559_04775 [Cohnella sp.]|nr:hypothetical protein [Cohnella sp.]